MTVITQAISDKKQQKEPLVGAEELPSSTDSNVDVEQQGPSPGRQGRAAALLVQLQRNRVHQIHSLTTTCVFLLALAVFTAGVFASFYVYQNYTQYKLRHFKGWCGVPYVSEEEPERLESLFERVQALSDSMGTDTNNGMSGKDLLEEEFELDLEFDSYEKIEVPDFARGRRGRFIHDFSLNKTGIIDMDGGRCFVMELNRSRIVPPKTLFDMINKINSGFYDVDTQVVRENYRVVTPPLEKSDEDEYGMYITSECSSFPMYRLERMTSPVFKRSTSSGEKAVFTEFAGNKISEFHIMNLDNIPGNRK